MDYCRRWGYLMGVGRDATDGWFSDCIRLRADWSCEHCGRQFGGKDLSLHCAHIHSRSKKIVRWCADNAVALCATCHHEFGASPVEFTRWLEQHLGAGALDILNEKSRGSLTGYKKLKAEISKHYRDEFRRMESTGDRDLVSYN